MWFYSDKVKKIFKNPKNIGEIKNADATGEVGSMACGDVMKITLKIDKKTQKIIDAKFKTFGCASAIAASSALTEMIKNMTIENALKITNKDIANYLDGLPKEKMHCSVLGMQTLKAAIANYKNQKEKKNNKIICACFNVTEKTIVDAIKENNLKTPEEITNYTKAGGACGKCRPAIEKLIQKILNKNK
jgi:NifU-like protein